MDKPQFEVVDFPEDILKKWQKVLNLLAITVQVPAALIMRVHHKEIEVYVASDNVDNPYEPREMASLNTGLYCETVMADRKLLLVPDATKDPEWADNPDIKLGMVSYAGMPILLSNGNVFGTICILDSKENPYTQNLLDLLEQFRDLVQDDIQLYETRNKLQQQVVENNELVHVLCHDLRNPLGTGLVLSEMLLEELSSGKADLNEIHDNANDIKCVLKDSLQVIDHVRALKYWEEKREGCELIITSVNLAAAIEMVLRIFQVQISQKKIEVVNLVSPQLSVSVEEASMINSVLCNVFSNAVKFSYESGKIVLCSEEDENLVMLRIVDEGIGIPESVMQNLFKLSNKPRRGPTGELGCGFGMPLVKRYMEIYPEGNVDVVSPPPGLENGTEVILTFQAT